MKRRYGIQSKIILPVAACVVLAFSIVAAVLILQFSGALRTSVEENAYTMAAEYSNFTKNYVNDVEASVFAEAITTGTLLGGKLSRQDYVAILASQIKNHPNWVDVWVSFEPNAFDGNDGEFAGKNDKMSLPDGRFSCLVSSDGSEPFEVLGEAFYDLPKERMKTTVTEPYTYEIDGKNIQMVTIASPIMVDGVVKGVFGVDIALDVLNNEIGSKRPYQEGQLRLLSATGVYVVNEDDKIVGSITKVPTALEAIDKNEVISRTTGNKMFIYQPVTFQNSNITWLLEVEIPLDIALAKVNQLSILALVIILAGVLLVIIILVAIARNIVRPVVRMSETLSQVGTTGLLEFSSETMAHLKNDSKRQDEIGDSLNAFINTMHRLKNVGDQLLSVANGDLTTEVSLLSDHDILGQSLKKMVDNLNDMFIEIKGATEQVSTGSKQIADDAQMLAHGATEQASAVEQLSGSLEQIAGKTQTNASMASKAASLSVIVRDSAKKGSAQMDGMMEAVKEISEASENIRAIIKLIDDIAFQTNILALNAAVEAARAGQHGKGFAVVADEVRNLAAKSAEAAKNTGSLIENSIKKSQLGAKIAEETAASLNEIVSGINESTVIIDDIAKSSADQSMGIEQINLSIEQVTQVVRQNSATSEESAAAAEEMNGQSNVLNELVARFSLKK